MGEAQPGDARWVDNEAVRFEQTWIETPRPRIKDLPPALAEPRRGLLLEELVRVERQFASASGRRAEPGGISPPIPGRCRDD